MLPVGNKKYKTKYKPKPKKELSEQQKRLMAMFEEEDRQEEVILMVLLSFGRIFKSHVIE